MSSSEKSRPSWFWPLSAIVVPVMGLLARVRITGAEKLPREGAYVVAPNHVSELDPLVVAVAVWRLGRAPRFMAKESLFRVPVLGAALRATGMVPVARTSSRDGAAQTMAQSASTLPSGSTASNFPFFLRRSCTSQPARSSTFSRCASARRSTSTTLLALSLTG